jgi:hypothetical protein
MLDSAVRSPEYIVDKHEGATGSMYLVKFRGYELVPGNSIADGDWIGVRSTGW